MPLVRWFVKLLSPFGSTKIKLLRENRVTKSILSKPDLIQADTVIERNEQYILPYESQPIPYFRPNWR